MNYFGFILVEFLKCYGENFLFKIMIFIIWFMEIYYVI